jgi:hypothetical protein
MYDQARPPLRPGAAFFDLCKDARMSRAQDVHDSMDGGGRVKQDARTEQRRRAYKGGRKGLALTRIPRGPAFVHPGNCSDAHGRANAA